MPHFAVSVVGRDRPGIVAAFTGVLLEHGVNIEDSQMSVLRGHFAMVLVVSAPADLDVRGLRAGIGRVGEELEMEAVAVAEVEELEAGGPAPASHIVSVYGADHPGIVHAVAAVLAERGANIVDLSTRLVGEDGEQPLYVMLLEIQLPEGLEAGELERALAEAASREGLDVTVRQLEQDAL